MTTDSLSRFFSLFTSCTMCRLVLGAVFMVSGIGKALDTTAFAVLLGKYGLPPFALAAPALALLEVALGLMLLLDYHRKAAAQTSLGLLLAFTIVFAWAYLFKGITDCGCFGAINAGNALPGWAVIVRNLALMGIAFFLISEPETSQHVAPWKHLVLSVALVLEAFVAGYTLNIPPDQFMGKHWRRGNGLLGKPVNETPFGKLLETSPDSSYMVFVFSYDCPSCWNTFENFRQYARAGAVDRIVGLATGTATKREVFGERFQPDFLIKDVPISDLGGQVKQLPTALLILNDSIKYLMQEEIASPHLFLENFPIKK